MLVIEIDLCQHSIDSTPAHRPIHSTPWFLLSSSIYRENQPTKFFFLNGNSIYDALTIQFVYWSPFIKNWLFPSHSFLLQFFSILHFSVINTPDSSKQRYSFLRNYFLSISFLVCVYCHKHTLILVFFPSWSKINMNISSFLFILANNSYLP